MHEADRIFREELSRRGVAFAMEEELYVVSLDGTEVQVSLDNLRRQFDVRQNPDEVVKFVDLVLSQSVESFPTWEEARRRLRYCLEPDDYEAGFEDVVAPLVTSDLRQVFVVVSEDGTRIAWLPGTKLQEWDVSGEELVEQAERNMAQIVRETALEVQEIAGRKLGMLATEEVPFKASLVLSPVLRGLVEPVLGWPVFAVVPSRDFVYLLSEDDFDFLPRLGPVVVQEWRESAYPITCDVLRLTDEGVTVYGTFPTGT